MVNVDEGSNVKAKIIDLEADNEFCFEHAVFLC
jgi:hypothetical protein